MFEIVVAVVIVLLVMIALMTSALKKTVKLANQEFKSYFIDKIQHYDELIEEREKRLDELNKAVEELKNIDSKVQNKLINVTNESFEQHLYIPEYRDQEILKKYKRINNNFNIDKEKVLINFLNNHFSEGDITYYSNLMSIKEKINFDVVYELMVMSSEQQLTIVDSIFTDKKEILEQYLRVTENFDCSEFMKYIDNLIAENDPTIYVKVGNKEENFDSLNKFIKTEYNEDIYIGMVIVYKNKLYDYTLS